MSFKDMTISEFIEEIASSSPTPGGGSAAAVAGAMGLALVSMVGALTPIDGMPVADAAKIAEARDRSKELLADLLECADDDTAAFDGVMAAYRMPKTTDDEKRARREAIQLAMKAAVAAPMRTLETAAEGMRLAVYAAEKGNVNAASDAGVGALLLDTAMGGAIFNIQINLAAIRDKEFVSQVKEVVEGYIEERDELKEKIVDTVLGNIGGE